NIRQFLDHQEQQTNNDIKKDEDRQNRHKYLPFDEESGKHQLPCRSASGFRAGCSSEPACSSFACSISACSASTCSASACSASACSASACSASACSASACSASACSSASSLAGTIRTRAFGRTPPMPVVMTRSPGENPFSMLRPSGTAGPSSTGTGLA